MDSVIIGEPEHSREDGWHVTSSSIDIDGKTYQIKYRVSEDSIATGPEPFLAATLLPAMKLVQPMQVSGTVSPKLLAATETIQDIIHKWFPSEFQKIPVQAVSGLQDPVSPGTEVGAFFSGGVDSFYTFLKHQHEITKIIFVHGFDMMLEKKSLRSKVSGEIRRVARKLGKPLIEVETNARQLSDQYTVFQDHYAGCMLASVGLLLSPQFRKIYIPATYSYEYLFPECTHPLLDPLWSTECLTFEHDGSEANRFEKITRIAQSDVVLQSLRVCLNNGDNSYNCGNCPKCLNTMVSLQALGALKLCSTFDRKLNIQSVARMKIWNDRLLPFVEENLRAIESNDSNPDLAEALRICLRSYKYDLLSTNLDKNLGQFLASKQGVKFIRARKNTILRSFWRNEKRWLLREVFKEALKDLDFKFLSGTMGRLRGNLRKEEH